MKDSFFSSFGIMHKFFCLHILYFIFTNKQRTIIKEENIMSERSSGFEIKPEQRQSWGSIALVWAGGMICVPCLMVGGVLSGKGDHTMFF